MAMPKCDVCGTTEKELDKCRVCSKNFCDSCGDTVDERCEFCSSDDEW